MNGPDGYSTLMGFAKAVNRREQEKKLKMADDQSAANQAIAVGAWAPPETTTARLKRLLFQLQCTQRSIAEAQAEIERVMASL